MPWILAISLADCFIIITHTHTHSHTHTHTRQYEIQGRVGKGTFGEVLRARRLSSSSVVALKKLLILGGQPILPKYALREILALKHLHHRNVVQLHDIVLDSNGRLSFCLFVCVCVCLCVCVCVCWYVYVYCVFVFVCLSICFHKSLCRGVDWDSYLERYHPLNLKSASLGIRHAWDCIIYARYKCGLSNSGGGGGLFVCSDVHEPTEKPWYFNGPSKKRKPIAQ